MLTNKLAPWSSRGFSVLTQNWIRSSHGHSAPSLKISCKSVQPFSHNLADKETKIQRNRSKTIPHLLIYRDGVIKEKGYTPMTLLEMLVFAAFTRQSRPSSSTLTVRFSLMYRHASLYTAINTLDYAQSINIIFIKIHLHILIINVIALLFVT